MAAGHGTSLMASGLAAAFLMVSCTLAASVPPSPTRSLPPPSAVASPITAAPPTPVPTVHGPERTIGLAWSAVPAFGIQPHGGFEHAFLVAERGAMIVIRNLEGDPTTVVATSADGGTWEVREERSDAVPFGQAVDGGTDWMLVVSGRRSTDPLRLLASSDGRAWEARAELPPAIRRVLGSLAAGDRIVLCGNDGGDRGVPTGCASSRDAGRTWDVEEDLTRLLAGRAIAGMASLGEGFLVLGEAELTGETIAILSANGSSWRAAQEPVPVRASSIVGHGDRVAILARGDDGVATSILVTSDGRTWERAALPSTTSSWFRLHRAGIALVAVGIEVAPEGGAAVSDVLVSADGLAWSSTELPSLLRAWQDPEFLGVAGGIVAIGDRVVGKDSILVGRVIGQEGLPD